LSNALKTSKPFDSLVISGHYCFTQALVIEKPLILLGKDFPSLDFQSLSAGIVLKADSIEIAWLGIFNIKKSSINDFAAIYAEDVGASNIHNNRVLNAFFGIYLANNTHSKVHHNYVKGHSTREQTTGNAIHLWQCDSIEIYNNYVTEHRDGIYLEFVTNSKVTENTSIANIRYGLHFMFSHHDVYTKNKFLKNEAGVAVMYSNHVSMVQNLFQDNWGDCSYGLLLKDIYDGELIDNVFERNTVALLMEGSNRLNIQNNE
jgi:nitrous oxidase accessory protein